MKPYTSADIYGYAKWLTQECQAAGLDAEQYGGRILVRGACHHLSETITCEPDGQGRLRWYWSWGTPIGRPNDAAHLLDVDDVGDLVRAIKNVVCVPPR